jgi:hypothetical protein
MRQKKQGQNKDEKGGRKRRAIKRKKKKSPKLYAVARLKQLNRRLLMI